MYIQRFWTYREERCLRDRGFCRPQCLAVAASFTDHAEFATFARCFKNRGTGCRSWSGGKGVELLVWGTLFFPLE